MTNYRQPDFVIVGAAKAATTWLQHCLQQHPDIFMADPELHFFSRCYDQGLDWYAEFFNEAGPDQLIGEKSNSYLDEDMAMSRLHAFAPDAKIIVQLRNPIERAYSDYCMLYRRGEVDGRIEYFLGPKSPLHARLLAGGCYANHISRVLEFYKREQVLVTLYDDIKDNADSLLANVADHLGVSGLRPATSRVKDKTEAMLPLRTRQLLQPLKPLVAPMRQRTWFKRLRSRFARPIVYPTLPMSTRCWLGQYYQNDVYKLTELLGQDLSHWLLPDIHESANARPAATARVSA